MGSDSRWFSDHDHEMTIERRPRPWKVAIGVAFALLTVSFGVWLYLRPGDVSPEPTVAEAVKTVVPVGPQQGASLVLAETRPVAVSSDGYVGSQACQTCHQHQHATWHDSFHRTMTQVGSPESIVGNFDGVEFTRGSRQYRLGHDREKFWVDVEFSGSSPDGSATTTRRNVMLCTGSHHMQVYWLSTGRGRELVDLPFVWWIAEQKWIPRESSFLLSPTSEKVLDPGHWNTTCIGCHTTFPNRNLDSPDPPQSTVAEFGIGCEACHGPGESHVRFRNKTTASTDEDPITHPLRLPHERGSQVCGQCHMAWQIKHKRYHPGDDLAEVQETVKMSSQFWSDGMIRVVGREYSGLVESACFERGDMSCFSCHTMHQSADDERQRTEWTDDQVKPGLRGDEACLSCHEEYRSQDKLQTHTHHFASSHGSRCYNCHMPNTTYGILKATRSHKVTSPTVEETTKAGRPNACNLCHLDKSLAWTDEKLVDWYDYPSAELPDWSETALSVRMSLAGDAGQRALFAWHLGWQPAREASAQDWLAPYLAVLMTDDYPAVRHIAHRSLKSLGTYNEITYDAEMSDAKRAQAIAEINTLWQQQPAVSQGAALLITRPGQLDGDQMEKHLAERDQTPIALAE